MKTNLNSFIHSLSSYDYILFGSVFFLFIVLVFVSLFMRHKLGLSILLAILAFGVLLVGPTYGYTKMHDIVYSNSLEMTSELKLTYSEAIVVKGYITNTSKHHLNECKITATAFKSTGNAFKDIIHSFKPIKSGFIFQGDITVGEKREFKAIVEPFIYGGDYTIELEAFCK